MENVLGDWESVMLFSLKNIKSWLFSKTNAPCRDEPAALYKLVTTGRMLLKKKDWFEKITPSPVTLFTTGRRMMRPIMPE